MSNCKISFSTLTETALHHSCKLDPILYELFDQRILLGAGVGRRGNDPYLFIYLFIFYLLIYFLFRSIQKNKKNANACLLNQKFWENENWFAGRCLPSFFF